jgi:hypothetical protein
MNLDLIGCKKILIINEVSAIVSIFGLCNFKQIIMSVIKVKVGLLGLLKKSGEVNDLVAYEESTNKEKGKYTGTIQNLYPNGQGILSFTNGDVYQGEWLNGEMHGQGKIKHARGAIYEGKWVEDSFKMGYGEFSKEKIGLYKGQLNGGYWKDGKGILKYDNGDVYDGQWKNDKKNGQGIMKYANGDVYDGYWKDDKLNGKGILKYADGKNYEGEYKDGNKQGKGTFKWPSGGVYEGDWNNGNRHGKGMYKWPDGDTYEGEFVNNNFQGKGIYKFSNGNKYEGTFKDDKRNGQGTMKYSNGDVYEGEWANGNRQGIGTFKCANGKIEVGVWSDDKLTKLTTGKTTLKDENGEYIGELVNGNKHGKGTMKYSSGVVAVYEGEWRDGKKHGKGTNRLTSGSVYEGDWENGKMSGKGIYRWPTGEIYEGQWYEGKINGKGIRKLPWGDIYEGEWREGKKHGKGTMKYNSGDVYEGEWKIDGMHGKGIYKLSDGTVYEGEYKDGIKHGKGTFKWPSGDVYEGEWKNNEKDGIGTMKWSDGDIYQGEWKEDYRNGKGIYKWSDGNIYEGEFSDGMSHGKGTLKYADGDIYIGEWYEDSRSGVGKLSHDKKILYNGLWFEDEFVTSKIVELVQDEELDVAFSLIRRIQRHAKNENRLEIFTEAFLQEIKSIVQLKRNEKLKPFIDKLFQIADNVKREGIDIAGKVVPKSGNTKKMVFQRPFGQPTAAIGPLVFDSPENLKLPDMIRIGELSHPLLPTSIPALVPLRGSNGICVIGDHASKKEAHNLLQLIAFRLLLSIRKKQAKFIIIDHEKNGASFGSLFGLDEKIVHAEIWDDENEITDGITDIKNQIPLIRSKYLQTKYSDLAEYNQSVAHSNQPFHFIMVANFPRGFNQDSAQKLHNLMLNGSSVGIYVLLSLDLSAEIPYGMNLEIFKKVTATIDIKNKLVSNTSADEWYNENFKLKSIDNELPANLEELKNQLNKMAEETNAVTIDVIEDYDDGWKNDSSLGVKIPIGITQSNETIDFTFGFNSDVHHALIGGSTGSGKSVLLHDLIINGALLYSPEQLQFILLDYKEGTEFKLYEDLPHIKVLSIASEAEFGISIFEFLVDEIARRGDLFKKYQVGNLQEYNQKSKELLPRYLIIIDEFQVLLNGKGSGPIKVALLMEDISRRGRSFGVNMILSTQSLGDVDITQSTLSNIGLRIGMKMPENDCTKILSYNNDVPMHFSRAGQAVYNSKNGLKAGNTEFQVAFRSKDSITSVINDLNKKADFEIKADRRFSKYIFDGNQKGSILKNKMLSERIKDNKFEQNDSFCDLYIGEPSFLQEEHIKYRIRKQAGSNVLVIGDQPHAAVSVVYYSLYQLIKQSSPESMFYIFNLFDIDSGFAKEFNVMIDISQNVKVFSNDKNLENILEEIDDELKSRIEEGDNNYRITLVFLNIQRSRSLVKEDEYELTNMGGKLTEIIKSGPDFAIHTILHTIRHDDLMKVIERNTIKDFENIIMLKGADPSQYIDDNFDEIKSPDTAYIKSPTNRYKLDLFRYYQK